MALHGERCVCTMLRGMFGNSDHELQGRHKVGLFCARRKHGRRQPGAAHGGRTPTTTLAGAGRDAADDGRWLGMHLRHAQLRHFHGWRCACWATGSTTSLVCAHAGAAPTVHAPGGLLHLGHLYRPPSFMHQCCSPAYGRYRSA